MVNSAAYYLIYAGDKEEFYLTIGKSKLTKVPYYRDKDNNLIRGKEEAYFRVPNEKCADYLEYKQWFRYQRGIKEIDNFIVYEHRNKKNQPSGLYKVVRREGKTQRKEYRSFYRARGDK